MENSSGKQGYVPANYVRHGTRRSSCSSLTSSQLQHSSHVEPAGSFAAGWHSDEVVSSTWDETASNSAPSQWSTEPKTYSQYSTDMTDNSFSSYSHTSRPDLYQSVNKEEYPTVTSSANFNRNSFQGNNFFFLLLIIPNYFSE